MIVAVAKPALAVVNVAFTKPGCTFTSILDFAAMRVGTMALVPLMATILLEAVPSVEGFLSKSSMISVEPSALMPLM